MASKEHNPRSQALPLQSHKDKSLLHVLPQFIAHLQKQTQEKTELILLELYVLWIFTILFKTRI